MKYYFQTTRRSPLEIEDSTIPKKILKRVIGARGMLFNLGCTSYDLRHLGIKFNVDFEYLSQPLTKNGQPTTNNRRQITANNPLRLNGYKQKIPKELVFRDGYDLIYKNSLVIQYFKSRIHTLELRDNFFHLSYNSLIVIDY